LATFFSDTSNTSCLLSDNTSEHTARFLTWLETVPGLRFVCFAAETDTTGQPVFLGYIQFHSTQTFRIMSRTPGLERAQWYRRSSWVNKVTMNIAAAFVRGDYQHPQARLYKPLNPTYQEWSAGVDVRRQTDKKPVGNI
jgi:hypothetical protein